MVASVFRQPTVDERAAALGDSAFQILTRHGVKGESVDLELELWRAIRAVLRRRERYAHVLGPVVGGRQPGSETAEVTAAAYDVALRHGFGTSFLDLELALWSDLRNGPV
jgi:hypothetical protein